MSRQFGSLLTPDQEYEVVQISIRVCHKQILVVSGFNVEYGGGDFALIFLA